MMLPETTRTQYGFTVEGASAALLEQLLDEYSFELKTKSRRIYNLMLPGLSADQIENDLGSIGITPPAELIVWWKWRNGFRPMIPNGMKHAQLSLATAIRFYQRESLGTELEDWNPNWIRVAGGGNAGDAVKWSASDSPPLVRAVSTFDTGTQEYDDTMRQVVSLCTPVTWWLIAIKKGWNEYEPLTGFWGGTSPSIPSNGTSHT